MAYTPESLALSPAQQAEVVRLVEAAGLDASEFVWAVQLNTYHLIGPLVSALVHTPTGYSFWFEERPWAESRVSVYKQGRPRRKTSRRVLGRSIGTRPRLADAPGRCQGVSRPDEPRLFLPPPRSPQARILLPPNGNPRCTRPPHILLSGRRWLLYTLL